MRNLLIIFSAFFSLQVFAGISLSNVIFHFEDDGKRSQDVVVYNRGTEVAYVRVEPSIIHNPGTDQEKREIYRDPKAAGLLVTPQKLVVPPGGRKLVRFVRMTDLKTLKSEKFVMFLRLPLLKIVLFNYENTS